MYPYERAKKLVVEIRKLGVNEQGKSFLDLFRILITEIGNALGYVRMVRSAAMYYCSEAVKFLPDLDEMIQFGEFSGVGDKGAKLSNETNRAAKNLDEVIGTLIKNFGEGSDYFKVLVNVFQSVLLNSEHEQLKVFYMIVPALCISWTEASLQAKEAVYRTTRGPTRELYFSDDGFAMGIAYCLAILKQTRKHEGLHWADSVRHKHKIDQKQLEEQQTARANKEAAVAAKKKKEASANSSIFSVFSSKSSKKNDDANVDEDYEDYEEVHTLQVTGKRLEAGRRETEQLFYSLSGAGIFFKRTDVDT